MEKTVECEIGIEDIISPKTIQYSKVIPILLKEDLKAKNSAKIELANALLELDEVSIDKSIKLCKWVFQKARYTKEIYTRKFGRLPKKIVRGDIVRIEFGINIGEELSDDSTDGHFAVIWAQQGFTFLVIPLTKKPQCLGGYAVNLGRIKGLPVDTDTYAKLDYMRWVYSARIKWLGGTKYGKITVDNPKELEEILNKIKGTIKDKFL